MLLVSENQQFHTLFAASARQLQFTLHLDTSKCQGLKRLLKNRYRNFIKSMAFLNASELLTEHTY